MVKRHIVNTGHMSVFTVTTDNYLFSFSRLLKYLRPVTLFFLITTLNLTATALVLLSSSLVQRTNSAWHRNLCMLQLIFSPLSSVFMKKLVQSSPYIKTSICMVNPSPKPQWIIKYNTYIQHTSFNTKQMKYNIYPIQKTKPFLWMFLIFLCLWCCSYINHT